MVVSVLLAALVSVTVWSTAALSGFDPHDRPALGLATGASWALAISAFLLLLRINGRPALVLVFAGSAALGLAALAGSPNLSNDSARYAWDGIVQNSGVSPYAYVPADNALDPFRPSWLFPAPVLASDGTLQCNGLSVITTASVPAGTVLCSALNRPQVPTIYPPVAEAFFAAVRWAVPPTAQFWPLQVAGLLLSLGTTTLLVLGMRRRSLDPRWAAVWGWSPFVAAEAVTNSHVDALGTLVVVAATFLATPVLTTQLTRGRAVLVGIGIGLAASTKFLPAIAAPPLARRRPITIGIIAAVTFAATYVPYVAATGWAVIGYLPGYLNEEGYSSGSRFVLISPFLSGTAATVVAGALILTVLAFAWWRTDPAAPWHAQTISIGAVLLIASPTYTWYALVLIPFIALSRRWEWLTVPIVLMVRPLLSAPWQATVLFLVAAIFVTALTVRRRATRAQTHQLTAPALQSVEDVLRKEPI